MDDITDYLAEIKDRVAAIPVRDSETAHYEEDAIHKGALRYIAEHEGGQYAELARAALKTLDLKFARWYA